MIAVHAAVSRVWAARASPRSAGDAAREHGQHGAAARAARLRVGSTGPAATGQAVHGGQVLRLEGQLTGARWPPGPAGCRR